MKLQFDAAQPYQLDAIRAVTDLFDGQPAGGGAASVTAPEGDRELPLAGGLVVSNQLTFDGDTLLRNVRVVQARHALPASDALEPMRLSPVHPTEPGRELVPFNFSVEMETGTGKTYVYLRAIHELRRRYGFKKFVIVVPSLAVKEGVLKNLDITGEHFGQLYDRPETDFYVYDPKRRGLLKHFAASNTLQILVINIDSFAVDQERLERRIIYQDSDWGVPVEYIRAVRPIVIVDEPQNMETDIRKRAIANLNPLCTLRFSATHRNAYNLVYRLDPVRAYDLGLVKRIEVDSVIAQHGHNEAFVELVSVRSTAATIAVRLRIDAATDEGVQRRLVTIRKTPKGGSPSDLYELSGRREVYRHGYIVDAVDVERQTVTFSNGLTLRAGESRGGFSNEIMREQIRQTVKNHFEKERRLRERGVKGVSLLFIDRVANYRECGDGRTEKGKLARWFEEAYEHFQRQPEFEGLLPFRVEDVHGGYFSQDRVGNLKDTAGESQADDDTYALIMRDKERLLSPDVPLRFIFSHTALREGWDNPNVFQICTLNETRSEMRKRQEIGRGLRLPVDREGRRVFDNQINILTVVANESYQDFAKTLQKEIAEECGVEFGKRVRDKNQRVRLKLRAGYEDDTIFRALWDRIRHKTRYRVEYGTDELIRRAAAALAETVVNAPTLVTLRASLDITEDGVKTAFKGMEERTLSAASRAVPDVLDYVQSRTRITRSTVLRILRQSGKLSEAFRNPQWFLDIAALTVRATLEEMMVDGIKYERIANEHWDMRLFKDEELQGYLTDLFTVRTQEKTLYDYVPVGSSVERQFARDLEEMGAVKFFFKLPSWFRIPTPMGTYNPDWAVVFECDRRVYFVAETKSVSEDLRHREWQKILCGRKHFAKLPETRYEDRVSEAKELYDAADRQRDGQSGTQMEG